MKSRLFRGLLILLLALVAGGAAYWATSAGKRRSATPARAEESALVIDAMPELEWLRRDLHLTPDQFEKVSALHAAYRPHCMEMCRRIAAARDRVAEAASHASSFSPELQQAIRDHAQTHADCQEAMVHHLYETAALLNHEQAARYLNKMLPYALDYEAPSSNAAEHDETPR